MVGVLCPSRFEYDFLKKLQLPPKKARVFMTGMGKVRALHGLHTFLKEYPKTHAILLVGFAGSLTNRLKVGDVIEPSVFIEQDYDARPFEPFPNKLEFPKKRLLPESLDAAMLTQDRFLKENPYASGPYAKKYPRLACDMESYAVAYACRQLKMKFHALKLISDTADENAGHDFLAACKRLSPKLMEVVSQGVQVCSRAG